MSSHKLIRIYMGGLILGANTLYRLYCFKLFHMVGKGLLDTPYVNPFTNHINTYGLFFFPITIFLLKTTEQSS